MTNAQGINARGDVVGIYTDTAGLNHGFLWRRGELATIDVPGARVTAARGIGRTVRSSAPTARGRIRRHPGARFLLTTQGEFLSMDFPGHANTIPQRILADGSVLGCYHDADLMGSMHGMMISRHGVAELPEEMSMHNGATPDGKLIVGLYTDMMDGRGKGYLYEGGTLTPLEVPGSTSTAAWDINPAGAVVGIFNDASGAHGFTFDGVQFTHINVPGARRRASSESTRAATSSEITCKAESRADSSDAGRRPTNRVVQQPLAKSRDRVKRKY